MFAPNAGHTVLERRVQVLGAGSARASWGGTPESCAKKGGGPQGPRGQHPWGHGMAQGVCREVARGRSSIQGPEGRESFTEEAGMQCPIPQPGTMGEGWKSTFWM